MDKHFQIKQDLCVLNHLRMGRVRLKKTEPNVSFWNDLQFKNKYEIRVILFFFFNFYFVECNENSKFANTKLPLNWFVNVLEFWKVEFSLHSMKNRISQ